MTLQSKFLMNRQKRHMGGLKLVWLVVNTFNLHQTGLLVVHAFNLHQTGLLVVHAFNLHQTGLLVVYTCFFNNFLIFNFYNFTKHIEAEHRKIKQKIANHFIFIIAVSAVISLCHVQAEIIGHSIQFKHRFYHFIFLHCDGKWSVD